MDRKATGSTLGQTLFALGIMVFLIGGAFWFFVGCGRYIKPYCENFGEPFYWIGMAIMGIGALLFIIGWLVMKEEKVDEPASSPDR